MDIRLQYAPPLKPRVHHNVCQAELLAKHVRTHNSIVEGLQRRIAFLSRCLLDLLGLTVVAHKAIKSGDYLVWILGDEVPHLCSLEGVLGNEFSTAGEGFGNVPANQITFGEEAVAVDEDRYFPV